MKSRLAVSFGAIADQERRHPSEEVSGHLVASGKEASRVRGARVLGRRLSRAFLGRLSLGPGLVWTIGLGRLARETELRPMIPTLMTNVFIS